MSIGIDGRAKPGMPAGALFTRDAGLGPAWIESADLGQTLVSAGIGHPPVYQRTGWTDVQGYPSVQAAINSTPAGGVVRLPSGTMFVDDTVTIGEGITLHGMGAGGVTRPTTLDFSRLPDDGRPAISVAGEGPGKHHVAIRDLFLTLTGGTQGGAMIQLERAINFDIAGVDISTTRTGCYGIKIGQRATDVGKVWTDTWCGVGSVENCRITAPIPVLIGQACTAIDVRNVYAEVGAGDGGFVLDYCTYCKLTACASDQNTVGYGYVLTQCRAITLDTCGAEENQLGHSYVDSNTRGVTWISPHSVGNNHADDGTIGDLLTIGPNGTQYNFTLISPLVSSGRAATNYNIYAAGTTGYYTTVIGANVTSLPKGYGGNAGFLSYLTTIGHEMRCGGVSEYADNATAVAAGLAVGTLYRTGDAIKVVH